MHQADPDRLLGELLAGLQRDEPLALHCRRWLCDGLAALARGEAASLDAGLGLTRRTGQHARLSRRLRLAVRDRHLADALAAVALDPSASTWERCRRLAVEVERFNRAWPAVRHLAAPRGDWPTVRRCLWAAACLDIRLPGSAHAILRAVARSRDCSRNGSALRLPAYAAASDQWPD